MPNTNIIQLAELLRRRRLELGLSASQVARAADIDPATYTRLEQGSTGRPQAENLASIARVLDLPASDLFAATEWLQEGDLPSVRPYLRSKYRELPESAIVEIEAFTEKLRGKHAGRGPEPGEDER